MNWWEKCKRSEPNIFKNGGLRVKKYIRPYASFPTYVPVHNYVYFSPPLAENAALSLVDN